MSMPLSHFVSASPSHVLKSILYVLCLYSCPVPRFIRTILNTHLIIEIVAFSEMILFAILSSCLFFCFLSPPSPIFSHVPSPREW